jgi:hypothetical protein
MSNAADEYDVYAEFGMTAEKAQSLEVAAGNVALSYLTLFYLYKTNTVSPEVTEMFGGIIDDLNAKTLGRLLRHVKSIGTVDDKILHAVDEALERRNYLIHRFFPTYNFAIFSETGRQEMIDELREIRGKLAFAEGILNAMAENFDTLAGRGGVSEKIAEELRSKGKRVKI